MTQAPAPAPVIAGHFIHLATPRRLPRAARVQGRVAVLDIAFASESGGRKKSFEYTTLKLIDALGERLVAWIDHHDSAHHLRYVDDRRFVLSTKAENGACPQMVTAERVSSLGPADSLICHRDFDGLASAAKWIRGGQAPYPECDADARAIDTRVGVASETGRLFDRAIRARPRDDSLALNVLELLSTGLEHDAARQAVSEAAAQLEPLEQHAEQLAEGFRLLGPDLAFVDVSDANAPFDRTWLLLLGQQRARMACVADAETVTFAAAFDSGISFVEKLGLSGGMPTLVSIHRSKLAEALAKLGFEPVD